MRAALLLQDDWESSPRVARLFLDAGHDCVVDPSWAELDSFDVAIVRANYWERGRRDLLAKAMVIESLGIPLLNSVRSILSCADKAVSVRLLQAAGLDVPESWTWSAGLSLPERPDGWVVKPRVGAHQRAVEVFARRADAQRYLESCSSEQLVQERIVGRYWRVIATRERAVRTYTMPLDSRGVTELPDGVQRSVVERPHPELEAVGVAAVRALGGTMLGVDVIEDTAGRYWTLEGNAGFGFNLGDAAVECAIVSEAEHLHAQARRREPVTTAAGDGTAS
jgi:glutathione synthase/RimK-type ligase-like ATP-grasp enzyme